MKAQNRAALWGALAAAMVVGTVAVGSNVTLPFNFTSGTTIRASEVNGNFQAVRTAVNDNFSLIGALQTALSALTARVTAVETKAADATVYRNPATGKLYTLNATFCGASAPTPGAIVSGSLTGNAAAKAICETTCSNSPGAHMCTIAEVQRFLATGGTFPGANARGWYSSGLWSYDSVRIIADCYGWTSSANNIMGPVTYATDSAHAEFCSSSFPILCCG